MSVPKTASKKSSKSMAEREAFHRRQMANPDTLMPACDPDQPVDLGALEHFDNLICSNLRTLGYPGTGKGGKPKACRPMSLAKKLASGSPRLSDKDIRVLAARIGWLQRNPFRWSARNGYEQYFASREAQSASPKRVRAHADSEAPSPFDAALGDASEGDFGPEDARPELLDDMFASIEELDDPPRKSVSSEGEDLPGSGHQKQSFRIQDAPFSKPSSEPDGPDREWSELTAEIAQRRPVSVPQLPERPKTYALEFPIPKAKSLLLSAVKQHPVERQIELAKELLKDRDELRRALARDHVAREDILNVLASLGVELEP